MQCIRINQLYNTLYKIIKHATNTSICLQCCSENAANCAYGGIKHTIETLLAEFQVKMILEEYIEATSYKYFRIKRNIGKITIIVRKSCKENSVMFMINNNMTVY
jgi:hypothetical protein